MLKFVVLKENMLDGQGLFFFANNGQYSHEYESKKKKETWVSKWLIIRKSSVKVGARDRPVPTNR